MTFSDPTTMTTDWDEFDLPDNTDSSLITDISRRLVYMSGENREKRRRQKLIDELVREHIEDQQQPKSVLRVIFDKFLKRN
ncbi:MAG: hypothetical protein LJE92_06265 [Gammaproteobacteria bacterium]|jgi:hypothetical protein|nr:hypothetical protein [Gammaproteobacteria bacterium]